jgi:hypothetical protein
MDNEGKHEEKEKSSACTTFTGTSIEKIVISDYPLISIADKVDILLCAMDLIKARSKDLITEQEYNKLEQMVKSSDEEIRNIVKRILKEKENGNI